ncbi:MAG TPA: helix-turn-helix domain-containing protein [Candidatus Sulfotelmatobacter sp.]|nr:helix-turn-helix domain-containing protein [Candidatus Sulfotelmatobacter sp.]
MPRHPDPDLEKRILAAASRLWARGGERALTMRAVAKAAGTTTPTVYERYRDRPDILRALRLETRRELFAALSHTRTLHDAIRRQLEFAMENSYAYEVLFDGVGKPPSLYEPWPSFNLMRERLALELGGKPQQHNRLILAIWCLMHGTAMLIIRGRFEGALRVQAIHACLDTVDSLLHCAALPRARVHSGPKWPANLILGEGRKSRVGNGLRRGKQPRTKRPLGPK